MIAKPSISEACIRSMIVGINDDLRSGLVKSAISREIWQNQKERLQAYLADWKAWHRRNCRHQRPSVRRHITRRVKTPA